MNVSIGVIRSKGQIDGRCNRFTQVYAHDIDLEDYH